MKFFKLANEAFKYEFESEEGFTFCASPPFNTLREEEIETDCGSSEENFQVAVVEGGTASQRRLLQRLDVFKASGTETHFRGNQ